jgi:LPS sulfotransferase NodH
VGELPKTRPSRTYIICATPRSGSNLLCEALTLSGVAGMPQEYFVHWESAQSVVPPAEYLDQVLTLGTDAGVFGMKIMWSSFDVFVRNLRSVIGDADCPPWDVVTRIFPDLRWVRITRDDKVRQAISLAKARQSGEWIALNSAALASHGGYEQRHMDRLDVFAGDAMEPPLRVIAGPSEAPAMLTYDFEEIRSIVTMLLEHEHAWENFFDAAGIRPCRVVYEQLAGSYETTTRALLAEMGLASPAPGAFERRVLNRQGDRVNEEWAERFARDMGA